MHSRLHISLSVILIALSLIIIFTTLLSGNDEIPDSNFANLEYSDKSLLNIPVSIKNNISRETLLVFVLDDVRCPTCLNDVVEFIDSVEQGFSNEIKLIVWNSISNPSTAHKVKESINREVLYVYEPLNEDYHSNFGPGNRYFFIKSSNKDTIAHLPLSSIPTTKEYKRDVINYILNNM